MTVSRWLCAVCFLAMVFTRYAGAEEIPVFKTGITDVTVFKDGHALLLCRGQAEVKDGWCRTFDVPTPLLGAFWTFIAEDKVEIQFVKSGFNSIKTRRPCLTIDELIQANKGKQVVLTDTSDAVYKGTLMGMMEHVSVERKEVSEQSGNRYDRYGRWIPARETRSVSEQEKKKVSSFVMIRTGDGVTVLKRTDIRSVVIEGTDTGRMIEDRERKREISIYVEKNGKPFTGRTEVGFVYIQRGIRWIPDYKVDIRDESRARVRLQGTIINDIADFREARVRLVVGVPRFLMKGEMSPMALRHMQPRLSSYFSPPSRNGSGSQQDYLSNAIHSQVVMPVNTRSSRSSEMSGPDIPSEGRTEDLFLYTPATPLSMKKGDRAVVKLLDTDVPYENCYKWELDPVPPREMWRHINTRRRSQLEKNLKAPKAVHVLRLENTGKTPWTTGPATVFKNTVPLAQDILTYTSVKSNVDLPVTVSVDINTHKVENEIKREHNAVVINSSNYTKVSIHGKLTIRNFKSGDVPVEVTRKVIGRITESPEGERVVSDRWDEVPWIGNYYWYGWCPYWWRHVNPVSSVTWKKTIPKNGTAEFEYDYFYYIR